MAEILGTPQFRELPGINMRALFKPESIDLEKRTVDVVFGSDDPVLMGYWENYYEILKFDTNSVRLQRLNSGAPLLDGHYGKQVGVVERAWVDGKLGYATIRFSKNPAADEIFKDVADGIKRNISIGYNIFEYREIDGGEGKISTFEATDWEPFEISIVSVPADIKAGVRSIKERSVDGEVLNKVKILKLNRQMTETPEEKATREANERAAAASEATRNAAEAAERARLASEKTVTDQAAIDAAITSERNRSSQILTAVRSAKLPAEFAEELIKDPAITIDKAREKIIAKFAEGDQGRGAQVNVTGEDERQKFRASMEEALEKRVNPGMKLEKGRQFANMNLMDLAGEACRAMGIETRGMSKREIAQIALGVTRAAGAMSTSDFPLILANVVNKRLLAAYELYPRTFTPFCTQSNASDFKAKTLVRLGDIVEDMAEVKEGGAYKAATMGENKESYVVKKYGRIINITWEMIVNDDLSAFSRIPAAFAQAAAQKQSDIVWDILLAGTATLSDGKAVFHADHNNLDAAGNAIDITQLQAGRKAIRIQKSLGDKFLNLAPSFLLVGPNKELEAYQYTSANYVPAQHDKINPAYNTGLKTIVEPRITDNAWMLACAPGMIDTIEYAFLEGEGELFTETRQGFEIDGVQVKARMVFGAAPIDYRGFFKNVGA